MKYFFSLFSSYVIGTVNQSDVTSLNLHKNFKWVLCVNHTEPVKNYLYRYLVRRLVDHEIKYQIRSSDLEKITKWMPRLWQHVNKYIELYNSADLTLGPKMFSTFPMDFDQSMSWFIDLWNSHLVPYIIETVKEGLQVYGTKNSWEDPKRWILETIPWLHDTSLLNSLYSIEAERVGMTSTIDQETKKLNRKSQLSQPDDDYNLDDEFPVLDNSNEIAKTFHVQSNLNENDKLLNMLMRLQEATLVNQQPKRSGLLPPTESNCFNSNEMHTKQSASVETTLI
jgi:neuron navigator 2